ncbi:MAG: P-loop NTPase, partial [Actinomycetia bacterium]|nr:P-loop NTPase [Actinomycetes bacterium]
MRVKLGIADPDPVFASEISAEFKLIKEVDLLWSKNSWDDVESSTRAELPDVVLFGPGWSKKRILSGFKKLLVNYPGLRGILVTADYSTELRRQASDIGFTGVFGIPIDSSELLLCLRRAAAAGKRRGSKETKTSGRIITVFSTKGGVGKTVIATNLAVALASEKKTRTILLDLDLQFGDVGVMLKLLPKHTLHDLVGLKNIDSGQINALLTKFNDRVSAFVAPLQ